MGVRWQAFGLLAVLFTQSSAASAQDAAHATVAETLNAAEAAEEQADPINALRSYRSVVAEDTKGRLARRAQTRIAWLEARSEANYMPLRALMTMQQLPRPLFTKERLIAFEREARAFPQGPVRRESRALIANAWLERFHDYAQAERAHWAWLQEPGLDGATRQLAVVGLARCFVARGDLETALAIVEKYGSPDMPEAVELARQVQRQKGRVIAWGVLGVFLLAGILSARRTTGLVQRLAWRRLGLLSFVISAALFGLAAFIAYEYDSVTLDTFTRLTLGLTAVLFVSHVFAAALHDDASNRVRRGLAVLAMLSSLAVGYLVLAADAGTLALGV